MTGRGPGIGRSPAANARHGMAGLWTHRQGHPHIYLLLLAVLIAIALLLLRGDAAALSGLAA
jgi:hypothetical protein